MNTDPTLIHDAANSDAEARASLLSVCCNAAAVDGDCSACELAAPLIAPQLCSACVVCVYDISGNGSELECLECGARWGELADPVTSAALGGMTANGWNPSKAPARHTQYLQSFAA